MTGTLGRNDVEPEIQDALGDRWSWLEHQAGGSERVVRKVIHDLEDAGRAEDRVRQDYTGRYPIELLQNAHDAISDAGGVGAVRFLITPSSLLVANEGVPFTHERVLSLVRQGSSEKTDRTPSRHTIGYKGVGFTAVFELCERPQILSRTVSFSFDRRRATKDVAAALGRSPRLVPSRYFPYFPIPLDELGEDAAHVQDLWTRGASTVIRLPFRRGRTSEDVMEDVTSAIKPEILLFMPAVHELEVSTSDETRRWRRKEGRTVGPGRVMTIQSSEQSDSWLVASRRFRAPKDLIEGLDDPLWAGVRTLSAGVAFPWKRGHVDPDRGSFPIHVYFPTDDELGRGVLLHGDFYVDSSRRRIATKGSGGRVSALVAEQTARLVGDLAESVVADGSALLAALAPKAPSDGFGGHMGEVLEGHLQTRKIVRSAEAKAHKPADLQRLDSGLGAEWDTRFARLLQRLTDLLHPGDDSDELGDFLDGLGCEPIDADELAARVRPLRDVSAYDASLKVIAQWVQSLSFSDRLGALRLLKSRPLLLDTENRWRVPGEVVLPSPEAPPLPKKLRRTVLKPPRGRLAGDLVTELGVETLSVERALDVVLKALNETEFGGSPGDCREVFAFVEKLWDRSRDVLLKRRDDLGVIPVKARTVRGKSMHWTPARSVYFSSLWVGDRVLEDFYGRFKKPEFLLEAPPAKAQAQKSRREFFQTLGVADVPRTAVYEGDDWGPGYQRAWASDLSNYAAWRTEQEVTDAFECPAEHPQSARSVRVEVIDRLDEVLDSGDAISVVRALMKLDKPTGAAARIRCTHSEHRGKRNARTAIGYQRWLLRTRPWIPVRNDPTGLTHRPPGEAWIDVSDRHGWLEVPQAALSASRVRGLGLVSAEHPRPGGIVRALEDLRTAYAVPEKHTAQSVGTADWLMRHLEMRLKKSSPDEGEASSLLAVGRGGRRMWAREPLIPDIPQLEMMTDLLVLPNGDWRALRRVYGLRRASEVVTVKVRRGGLQRSVGHLSGVAGFQLLALLTKLGSDPRPIAFRLARLAEYPVSRLTLTIRYESQEWEVAPTHYLRVRRDTRGHVAGGALYWNVISRPSAIELGRDIASYLDEAEHESLVAYFLREPAELLHANQVGSEDLKVAEDLMTRQSRRKLTQDDDDILDEHDDEGSVVVDAGDVDDLDQDVEDEETAVEPDVAAGAKSRHLRSVPPPGVQRESSVSEEAGDHPSAERESVNSSQANYIDPMSVSFGAPVPGRQAPTQRREAQGDRPTSVGSTNRTGGLRVANPETEKAAVDLVVRYGVEVLQAQVVDVQEQNKGWDLEFYLTDGTWQAIEVKGSAGQGRFVITRNELRHARSNANYFLYFVTNLEKGQEPRIIRFSDVGSVPDDHLDAVAWEVDWSALRHEVIPLTIQAAEVVE